MSQKGGPPDVFRFIDTVESYEQGRGLVAGYSLRGDEEFLKDHFERFPVMPGVLQIESARQAGSLFLAADSGYAEPAHRICRVEEAKFGQFVKPGSHLKISVSLRERRGPRAVVDARIEIAAFGPTQKLLRTLTARLELEPSALSETEKEPLRRAARQALATIRPGA